MNNKLAPSLIFESKAGSFNKLESNLEGLNQLVEVLEYKLSEVFSSLHKIKITEAEIQSAMECLEEKKVDIVSAE